MKMTCAYKLLRGSFDTYNLQKNL